MLLGIHDLVANAKRSVDITLLEPVPDFVSSAHCATLLLTLALSGRPVTVRIVVGQYRPTMSTRRHSSRISRRRSTTRPSPG